MRKHVVLALFMVLGLATVVAQLSVRELGIPVKGINWVRIHPGALEGRPSVLLSMGQNNGGLFVCDVDLTTGHCRQFSVGTAQADFPTASLRSPSTGILYIGSAWSGHLHRYDPAHPERGVEDLGAIDSGHVTFPCGIQEAPDGSLYIGSYPEANLTRYDPATGQFRRFGRIDETDKYLYPLVGDDGTLAMQVKVTRYFVVAMDPRTGERRQVGPEVKEPSASGVRFQFFKGEDGGLYLDTDAGSFRIKGMQATPVSRLPAPRAGVPAVFKHDYQAPVVMPGGWTASMRDYESSVYRTLRLQRAGEAPRDLCLDWAGAGSLLFLIHHGPDGRVYGSSYLPEHLFRCELDGSGMVDLGQCSVSLGEGYSMENFEGKLAIASYPAARLSLYDPALPYRFGTGPGANPLDVGPIDDGEIGYRPHFTLALPDGKLWIGAAPNYGLRSGTLSWFDLRSAQRHSHRSVVENLTPVSALWLPVLGRLLIGLSIEPGSGVQVNREHGAFALWDPARDCLDFAGDFGIAEPRDVVALVPTEGGLVYALLARPSFLVEHHGAKPAPTAIALLDPVKRRVVAMRDLPAGYGGFGEFGFKALRADGRGRVFGVTAKGIYRVKLGTCETEWLGDSPASIDVVGPIVGRTLYFGSKWKLMAVDLPE
jgi:hypothetical protein